jgi:hypothetical protein
MMRSRSGIPDLHRPHRHRRRLHDRRRPLRAGKEERRSRGPSVRGGRSWQRHRALLSATSSTREMQVSAQVIWAEAGPASAMRTAALTCPQLPRSPTAPVRRAAQARAGPKGVEASLCGRDGGSEGVVWVITTEARCGSMTGRTKTEMMVTAVMKWEGWCTRAEWGWRTTACCTASCHYRQLLYSVYCPAAHGSMMPRTFLQTARGTLLLWGSRDMK